jgi:tRNA (mo5U34)-methyltransferase
MVKSGLTQSASWDERLDRIRKETDQMLAAAPSIEPDHVALSDKVKQHFWWHSIDLGNGIVTPGKKSPAVHAREAAAIFDPIKMDGVSVLDVGAWNGFYSFEAKRRGARRVMAMDHYTWNHEHFRGREAFELARSALGYDIETADMDVMELCPEMLGGTFDVVLFLGVLYHLFDPIEGLRRAASVAKEVLVVETHTDLENVDRPAMVMYPGSELNNDPTNWWGPNSACVRELLKTMGFARIDERSGGRPVFHAWRLSPLRP